MWRGISWENGSALQCGSMNMTLLAEADTLEMIGYAVDVDAGHAVRLGLRKVPLGEEGAAGQIKPLKPQMLIF